MVDPFKRAPTAASANPGLKILILFLFTLLCIALSNNLCYLTESRSKDATVFCKLE